MFRLAVRLAVLASIGVATAAEFDTVTAGTCQTDAMTAADCLAAAGARNFELKSKGSSKNPSGCYMIKNKVYFNLGSTNTGACTEKKPCICRGDDYEAPHLPNVIVEGTCPESISAYEKCTIAAGHYFDKMRPVRVINDATLPPGCITNGKQAMFNAGGEAECTDVGCFCDWEPTRDIRYSTYMEYSTTGELFQDDADIADACPPLTIEECRAAAVELMLPSVKPKIKKNKDGSLNVCHLSGKKLNFGPVLGCSQFDICMCGNGYNPAPTKFVASGSCESGTSINSAGDCAQAAALMGVKSVKPKISMKMSSKKPNGCYVQKNKVYFTPNNMGECTNKAQCLCLDQTESPTMSPSASPTVSPTAAPTVSPTQSPVLPFSTLACADLNGQGVEAISYCINNRPDCCFCNRLCQSTDDVCDGDERDTCPTGDDTTGDDTTGTDGDDTPTDGDDTTGTDGDCPEDCLLLNDPEPLEDSCVACPNCAWNGRSCVDSTD